MVKLYNKENRYWCRNSIVALLGYIRDLMIQIIPFKLPLSLIHLLYGVRPDFVFLVHPRQSEDIYRALPFLTILRKNVSKKVTLKLFKHCLPCVIGEVKSLNGSRGLIISSFYLPEVLLANSKNTLMEARKCTSFASKLLSPGSYVGLGAWWPIVTRRGIAISKYSQDKGVNVTNGHTGTLISLLLFIEKITDLADVELSDLKILIIGTGKMGGNLGKALADRVRFLGLVDINKKRIDRVEEELKKINNKIVIEKHVWDEGTNVRKILNMYDLAVCVTSNAKGILDDEDIPDNYLIIDDSRPEAISRENIGDNKVVLEGGLIKIMGLTRSYDYGFGVDDNVFGCLAETYALSLSKKQGGGLQPTLGDVNMGDYKTMFTFFRENGLEVGDFKSARRNIDFEKIKKIITKRFNQDSSRSEKHV